MLWVLTILIAWRTQRSPDLNWWAETQVATITQPPLQGPLCSSVFLVLRMICCGPFPVAVRIALLFPFPKKPKKLGEIFHSIFYFLSVSQCSISLCFSILFLFPFLSVTFSWPKPPSPWKTSGLTGKANPGLWASCEDNTGHWSALPLCRGLHWVLGVQRQSLPWTCSCLDGRDTQENGQSSCDVIVLWQIYHLESQGHWNRRDT